MREALTKILLSTLALSFASSCVLPRPTGEDFPTISIPESATTLLSEYNIRGYVLAVVICPRFSKCVRMDGVDIAAEPVTVGEPDYLEKLRGLRDRDEIMTLPIGVYRRFDLEVGQEYLFSFRAGHGVVGVSAEI